MYDDGDIMASVGVTALVLIIIFLGLIVTVESKRSARMDALKDEIIVITKDNELKDAEIKGLQLAYSDLQVVETHLNDVVESQIKNAKLSGEVIQGLQQNLKEQEAETLKAQTLTKVQASTSNKELDECNSKFKALTIKNENILDMSVKVETILNPTPTPTTKEVIDVE